jgi:hypothetical protein
VVLNEKWYAMLDSKQSLRLKMAQITRRQNLRMAKSQVDIQTIIHVLLFKRNISEDTIELNQFKKLNKKLGKA